jgi:hypothetical protein
MIYDEPGGRRPRFLPLRGRRIVLATEPEPDAVTRDAILRVWEAHPRWGPRQIHAELRFTRRNVPLSDVEVIHARYLGKKRDPDG